MKKYLPILIFLMSSTLAWGYELGTHAHMTQQAHLRSDLASDPTLINDLGITDFDTSEPFGKMYYDVEAVTVDEREAHDFSTEFMPDNSLPLSLQGWLMRGAIREDDYTRFLPCGWGRNPQDDKYSNPPDRPINHFFDPVNNDTIFIPFATPQTAPNWALGTTDVNNPDAPDPNRRNHFTILDAREAMYRALTGRDNNGLILIGPNNTLANETVRKAYWATTFRVLGDVVHLIQDMGQPQHTRKRDKWGQI